MAHPLIRYPNRTVILPPHLFPSIGYYHAMAVSGCAVIDTAMRYDKRCKAVHRYEIIDARGPIQLTVPLGKPHGCTHHPTWHDTPVSTHDDWWRRHRTALESAYGRTPYFEFLIDRFDFVFRSPEDWPKWPSAIDLIREANKAICSILTINPPLEAPHSDTGTIVDLRDDDFDNVSQPPYWQVRQHIHGFQTGLSILDLLFNLGPESQFYIHRLP